MEGGWACYHGDGFLEHLSFSASGFMDSTVNASSKSTVPTTPLHFCCHAIGPGEKDDHRSLIHAWSRSCLVSVIPGYRRIHAQLQKCLFSQKN